MLIQQPTAPAPVPPALPANPAPSTVTPGAPGDAAQTTSGEPQIIVTPPYRANEEIPKDVVPLVAIVFGSLTAMVLLYPIIRFVTRMIERKTDRSKLPASEVTAQLRALQDSLDTMAIEIERISEAQRFQAKLMVERDRAALPESRGGA